MAEPVIPVCPLRSNSLQGTFDEAGEFIVLRYEDYSKLLQSWIDHFGGRSDCEHEAADLKAGETPGGYDCSVCGGHLESEDEPDLDPGHDPDCIQLMTCMALRGQPQRKREEVARG